MQKVVTLFLLLTLLVNVMALPLVASAQTPAPTAGFCGLTQKLLDLTGITDLYNSLTSYISDLLGNLFGSITGSILGGIILGEEVPVKDKVVRTNTSSLVNKEYVCDPLTHFIAAVLIRSLTNSIIAWIQGNNGRDVGFIANFEEEFRNQIDIRGGEFLDGLSPIPLCGNIGAFLQLSLRTNRSLRDRFACTVTDIVANIDSFFADFSNGGWPAFIRMTMEPQNNPYGAFLLAADAKAETEFAAAHALRLRAETGIGFEGQYIVRKNCPPPGEPGPCFSEKIIKTPGHLVAGMLQKTVDTGYDFAVAAHEIDEAIEAIITALIGQLINSAQEGIFNPSLTHLPALDKKPPKNMHISTFSLPNGEVDTDYNYKLSVQDGTPPYTWQLAPGSQPLPPGLILSSDGTISGKPLLAGTYSFTIEVIDSKGETDTQTLTLQITSSMVTGLGNIIIKRVNASLANISGTSANVDATVSQTCAQGNACSDNPSLFTGVDTSSGHGAHATNLSGFSATVGVCFYQIEGSECPDSSISFSPPPLPCSSTDCNVGVSVVAGQVTKVVYKYQ